MSMKLRWENPLVARLGSVRPACLRLWIPWSQRWPTSWSTTQSIHNSLIYGSTQVQAFGEQERGGERASIDLRHFTQLLLERLPNADITSELEELTAAIDRFVVHSRHDGTRPNSFGIAIDAPENTDTEYEAYKVSDAWIYFQEVYGDFRNADTSPPTFEASDTSVIFSDDNLAVVQAVYGFVETVEFDDGSMEDYFMVVAELEAVPSSEEGEYLIPTWDRYWFTVEYDSQAQTAWIPAAFDGRFEEGGLEYTVYVAEIDYVQSGKDYGDEEDPYDLATLTLFVDEDGEVVDHQIETYQYVYSGPDDQEGTVRYDKATYWLSPGDAVRFWNFGFSLADEANDDWFEASDFVTFVQEPVFLVEYLEFEDELGELIEYYYALWAEDISGNGVLTELIRQLGSRRRGRRCRSGFGQNLPWGSCAAR